MVDGTKGLGLGPVEAVVAQLSVGTSSIALVLSTLAPRGEIIALFPLVGLAWVLARVRERQKDTVLGDGDEEVATDGGSNVEAEIVDGATDEEGKL